MEASDPKLQISPPIELFLFKEIHQGELREYCSIQAIIQWSSFGMWLISIRVHLMTSRCMFLRAPSESERHRRMRNTLRESDGCRNVTHGLSSLWRGVVCIFLAFPVRIKARFFSCMGRVWWLLLALLVSPALNPYSQIVATYSNDTYRYMQKSFSHLPYVHSPPLLHTPTQPPSSQA